jgi:hypothetical protein
MRQKLKRTNASRFASLTALGAGALGVAASPASASDIVFSGVINAEFPYTIPGPNGAGGALAYKIDCEFTCFNVGHLTYIVSKPGNYGTQFRLLATGPQNSWALGEPLGAVWGTVAGKSTKSANLFSTYDGLPYTGFTSTGRYMLFRFEGGALKHPFYGWARIQVNHPSRFVEVVDWAYDPSGVHIPAGYHSNGGQVVPEEVGTEAPAAAEATGLSALALGAPGVRRWRYARRAAMAGAPALGN